MCCPRAACGAALGAEGVCPMDPAVITAAPVAAPPMLLVAEGFRCLLCIRMWYPVYAFNISYRL